MACPCRWALWRLLGIVPTREPNARARGSLIHEGLMWRYLARRGGTTAVAVDPFQKMRDMPDRYAHQYGEAERVVQAYIAYWDVVGDWDGDDILAVEREHQIVLTHPAGGPSVPHTQRLDLVVRIDGKAWVVDHKSTSGAVDSAVRDWEHSGQFAMLEVIGRALFHLPPPVGYGMPYGGLLLNHIGTKTPHVLERRRVYPAAGFVASTPLSMIETAWRRDALRASGLAPMDYPRHQTACHDRYGQCDYLRICAIGAAALNTGLYEHDAGIVAASRAAVPAPATMPSAMPPQAPVAPLPSLAA